MNKQLHDINWGALDHVPCASQLMLYNYCAHVYVYVRTHTHTHLGEHNECECTMNVNVLIQ